MPEKGPEVTIEEIHARSASAMEKFLGKKVESVVGIRKEGSEWKALVEVLERRAVPDTQDLLGQYEVSLDEEGKVLGYKRVLSRLRVPPYGEERREEES